MSLPTHSCAECYLPKCFCYCAAIPTIINRTWLSLVMHVAEVGRISNTGNPLVRALQNSDLSVIGKLGTQKFTGVSVRENKVPVLLYPDSAALNVDQLKSSIADRPIQLVLLDGTWSQTKRMLHHNPCLYSLPKLSISSRKSNYILRNPSQQGRLCTIEAAAYALLELEGESVSTPLLDLLGTIKEGVFRCNPVRRNKLAL